MKSKKKKGLVCDYQAQVTIYTKKTISLNCINVKLISLNYHPLFRVKTMSSPQVMK